jgi:hypothetical protein
MHGLDRGQECTVVIFVEDTTSPLTGKPKVLDLKRIGRPKRNGNPGNITLGTKIEQE